MKRKNWLIGMSGLLLTAALLAGCGSSAAEKSEAAPAADAGSYSYSDDVYSYAATEEAVSAEENFDTATGGETESVGELQDSRKLIKNVNMNVETEEFDKLLANIENKITSLGGYAQYKDIGGNSYYGDSGNRYASVTARIPSERLEEFVNAVAQQSNVTSKNESVDDVTLQYVDIEAHRDSLRIEMDRLNELLDQAQDLETIIGLESRLTEVRYQLESYESQLRSMDNQVDYSTVYLYISEVERLTPQSEKSAWDRMSTGFAESVYNVGKGLQNFGIGFVIAIPYLFVIVVVIGIIVAVVLLIVKGMEKSQKKKQQKSLPPSSVRPQEPVNRQPDTEQNQTDTQPR